MRKLVLTIVACLPLLYAYSQGKELANPASLYVKFLGFESKMEVDSYGNQLKVCILPDGTKCDEWAFFRGKCGTKYSYCALKGCVIEIDSISTAQFAVCTCTDSLGRKTKLPLIDFMEMNGDALFKESKFERKK